MDKDFRSTAESARRFPAFIGAVSLLWFVAAAPVQAASVTYYLDQSSRLPDGTDYLKVTIDDEGASGAINFHIQALDPLTGLACDNSGILKFGFNGDELGKNNILGLPDDWKLMHDKKISEFGKYENVLTGKKWNAQDSLNFSIVGIDGDNIYSYATSHDAGDGAFFSTFVGGTERDGNRGDGKWYGKWYASNCHSCTKVGYFGGGELTPVPLPGAVWLLSSGLVGLLGLTRRNRNETVTKP